MIEYVHKHIISELNQNTRSDTIFILTSIFLNLITLAVNSGMSGESGTNASALTVMFVFVSLIPGYEYDIFKSYRQKDNKGDRWVSEFRALI